MMRALFFISSLVFIFPLHAQETITLEEFHISFQTEQELENYDTGFDEIIGYDNDLYAVEIAMVPLEYVSLEFRKDVKYGAKELAQDLDFKDISDGGTLPHIENAYYVIAKEYDEDEAIMVTIYVVAIVDMTRKVAYEATVYCYTDLIAEGEKMMKSFRLVD